MADKVSEGVSVRTMTIGVMVFLVWFFWGIAASSYHGATMDPGAAAGAGGLGEAFWFGVTGIATFFGNSLKLTAAPAVITYVFEERIGIFWTFLIFEALALGFGLGVKKLEMEMEKTSPQRKKKKRRKRKPGSE